VLRGADAAADRIGNFALAVFATVDGRPIPKARAVRSRKGKAATSGRGAAPPVRRAAPKSQSLAIRPDTDGQAQQRPASSA
jgi:hypothetical protein